eukprot:CAMPEP_0113705738 /NCGR_PEP_ID=MMETSP0038_2-20120614/27311_1 /TAXON_ID=2898 /ORGANISM="Cryptomonas paramecium" /LENGTH=63 /DNA_ID=CAMNT_0000630803 /DNA_START=450 /DNA_END=641 /DNA_ORIENTATION=+ /assembly_acc=CAM_ASM_000170
MERDERMTQWVQQSKEALLELSKTSGPESLGDPAPVANGQCTRASPVHFKSWNVAAFFKTARH